MFPRQQSIIDAEFHQCKKRDLMVIPFCELISLPACVRSSTLLEARVNLKRFQPEDAPLYDSGTVSFHDERLELDPRVEEHSGREAGAERIG